jgi:hypothetical protein
MKLRDGTFGGRTGWWGHVGSPGLQRSDLGGRRFAARLVFEDQTGVIVEFALAGWRSVLVGFYPDHDKHRCLTMARPHRIGEELPIVHRCWASFLPQRSWGPDPAEIRRQERAA